MNVLDTGLIYVALTVFGILAGTAILISAAIVSVAAMRQHRTNTHGKLTTAGGTRREPALR